MTIPRPLARFVDMAVEATPKPNSSILSSGLKLRLATDVSGISIHETKRG
jgi:hypothetical protein